MSHVSRHGEPGDVYRMLAACLDWQESLCVAAPLYLGAPRKAISPLRREDVDLVRGTARFPEKGGKVPV